MNNQMIGECKCCGRNYCMECSGHTHWEEFCNEKCYDEYCGEPKTNPKEEDKPKHE